jgi:hypothetical protein
MGGPQSAWTATVAAETSPSKMNIPPTEERTCKDNTFSAYRQKNCKLRQIYNFLDKETLHHKI